jgi:hypothetical protein
LFTNAKIILESPIPKIPGYQAAAAMPSFEGWMVLAQLVVARIVAVFGPVDIFLDLEEHIPDPCFDIACRVEVACCLRSVSIVSVTGGGTVVGEEIAGLFEDYNGDRPGVMLDEVATVATFEFVRDTHTVRLDQCR